MTSINNGFGNLTAQSGKKLEFRDIDTNNDGKITKEEWNAAQEEYGFDTVDFDNVNTSGTSGREDSVVDSTEFAILEQKIAMSEYVTKFCDEVVSTDTQLVGTGYVAQVKSELIAYIDDFVSDYTGELSDMAEAFKAALNTKYTEMVKELSSNKGTQMPVTLKDSLEDAHETFIAKKRTELLNTYPEDAVNKFIQGLEAALNPVVEAYMKTWVTGTSDGAFSNGFTSLLNSTYAKYANATENSAEYQDLAAIVNQATGDDYISSTDTRKIKDAFIAYLTRLESDGNTAAIIELGFDATNWTAEIATMTGEQLVEAFNKIKPDLSNLEELKQSRADKLDEDAKKQEAREDAISEALDNILNTLLADIEDPEQKAEYMDALGTKLEGMAKAFAANYEGNEEDFVTKLEEYLNTMVQDSDKARIESEYKDFSEKLAEYGGYIDSKEFAKLKEDAKEFLKQAIAEGVIITLNGLKIVSEGAITVALGSFKTGKELVDALNEAYNALSDKPMLESVKAEADARKAAEADAAFRSIKGEEYQVNAATIDYSKIDGYHDNEKVTVSFQQDADTKIKEKAADVLTQDALKSQIKQQIEAMLEEKGIPFSKIQSIFDTVYAKSVDEAIEAVIKGQTVFTRAKFNTKTLVDKFITTFNTNIANAINEVNEQNTDFDIAAVNRTPGFDSNKDGIISGDEVKDIDGDGKISTDEVEIYEALQTGQTVTTDGEGRDYYESFARDMIENLQNQMLEKAKSMCDANGIEFDETVFDAIYGNATEVALNNAVTGWGSYTYNAITHFSASTFDPRLLMDTFLSEFQTNYTSWVEGEKTEKK